MKLSEVKIKIVMNAENVSRERAIEIIAERQSGHDQDVELAIKTPNIGGDDDGWVSVEDFFDD